ncbi:beta-1 adrenergic receptor [Elysia marginata]|uniref:Beta-1 adrenergic receptor n=1 Tax=Elysia marginata TaxID=1093978 RepID=A0AAV4FL05_9GAST|nr:beta-1 adrenergic receptor [Elysia marginata]
MSSSNISNYKDELSQVTLTDAGLSVMALFLALFITSANATTIMAIWRTPALRTLANTYVCSLACADFIVGLACVLMALFMLPPLRLELFYKNIEVCSLFQGIVIGMVLLSAIHMTLIAVDRVDPLEAAYLQQRLSQPGADDLKTRENETTETNIVKSKGVKLCYLQLSG